MTTPTSYDALIAAAAAGDIRNGQFQKFAPVLTSPTGHAYSTWGVSGGFPVAGGVGTALTARQVTGATTGALAIGSASASETLYLTTVGALNNLTGLGNVCVVDRLLDYYIDTLTSTSAQSMTNTLTLPEPYLSNPTGVMMFLEVTANIGAGTPNITITYTNQAGTGGQVATVNTMLTAPVLGRVVAPVTGFFIPLASGDTGVKSVQSIQLSATWTSGTACLVLCKPMCYIPQATTAYVERDLVLQTPKMPALRDNSALQFLVSCNVTTAATNFIAGEVTAVSSA